MPCRIAGRSIYYAHLRRVGGELIFPLGGGPESERVIATIPRLGVARRKLRLSRYSIRVPPPFGVIHRKAWQEKQPLLLPITLSLFTHGVLPLYKTQSIPHLTQICRKAPSAVELWFYDENPFGVNVSVLIVDFHEGQPLRKVPSAVEL